jgi:dTDP-glucose 4,6-dehydratase
MSKTVLVTGGAGFIGSNFVHFIRNKYPNYKIVVLDALTYAASIENIPTQALQSAGVVPTNDTSVQFWYGNVCNAELVDARVEEADYVVHFAAETHVTRSIYDNLTFFKTDVIGTQIVSNAVLKHGESVEMFIHISTSEVYGTAISTMMDEDHPLDPMSPYAAAKCGADRLVSSYVNTYDIPAVILRPFNNYGPRQHLEKLIPRFITSSLLGEPLTVHGEGQAARDFVHVEDTCRAIDLVMHADVNQMRGKIYNIASGTDRTVQSIAEDITKKMTVSSDQIVYTGDRPGQVVRHTGDASRITEELGWTQQISWDRGLSMTIDWFTNEPDWWSKQLWMRHIPIRLESGKIEMH